MVPHKLYNIQIIKIVMVPKFVICFQIYTVWKGKKDEQKKKNSEQLGIMRNAVREWSFETLQSKRMGGIFGRIHQMLEMSE